MYFQHVNGVDRNADYLIVTYRVLHCIIYEIGFRPVVIFRTAKISDFNFPFCALTIKFTTTAWRPLYCWQRFKT